MKHSFNTINNNIDQEIHQETERKFTLPTKAINEKYWLCADRITQLYLSTPQDEYSLRLRCRAMPGLPPLYLATLKSRGIVRREGLSRMEVETSIDEGTFRFYSQSAPHPTVNKRRITVAPGISIDQIAGLDYLIVEVEDTASSELAKDFLSSLPDDLSECTGLASVDNEQIAFRGYEAISQSPKTLQVGNIVDDIIDLRRHNQGKLAIGISGRSGSGKSTISRELKNAIELSPALSEPALLVSTDDYNRGRKYLESTHGAPWTNWEDPIVYNTELLASDIKNWREGMPIRQRFFDFSSEEPAIGDILPDSRVLVIEGIHAGSDDLARERQLHYEMPTTLATSLGRDLMRLLSTDRLDAAMKSPEERLRYVLEIGEPTYLKSRN